MKAQPYLISRINQKAYAIDMEQAQEVLHAGLSASEPKNGCFFIRFEKGLLPVVDLHWFFAGSYEVLKRSTRLIMMKSEVEGFRTWGLQAPGLTEVERLIPRPLGTPQPFIKSVSQGSLEEVLHVDMEAIFKNLLATLPPGRPYSSV